MIQSHPHFPTPTDGPPVTTAHTRPLIPYALSLSVPTNACKPLWTHSPRPAGFGALGHPDCILMLEKTQEAR